MKDIIIKNFSIKGPVLLCCLAFASGCESKIFNSISEIISGNSSSSKENKGTSQNKRKIKNISISKDKDGNYQVSWKVLKEYDLSSKDIGVNLNKVINQSISIKGFMIPLDYSAKNIKKFLQ